MSLTCSTHRVSKYEYKFLKTPTEKKNYLGVVYLIGLNRDSAVCKATGYGLDDRGVGVRVSVGSRIFSTPRRPDGLWGPPNLLCNGYRRLFPQG
jgi:hypothetical protein